MLSILSLNVSAAGKLALEYFYMPASCQIIFVLSSQNSPPNLPTDSTALLHSATHFYN